MRRKIIVLSVGVVVCLGTAVKAAVYGGGSGTEEDPYQIWTAAQMNEIGLHQEDWIKDFILMADINMGAYTGTSYNIIGTNQYTAPFLGTFDGNGHSIFNFTYQSTEYMECVGIFGAINSGGVHDLKVVNPLIDVPSAYNVGAITGFLNLNVTIRDCCVSGGFVTGRNDVGGMVGELSHGIVLYSYNTATVEGNDNVGGIIGYAYGGYVVDSYSNGDILGFSYCGGAIGYLNRYASIVKCYSTGVVSAYSYEGGLVGASIGKSNRCFWDVTTSNQSSSEEGTGLTTEEMKQIDTYAGWGCSGVWVLDEGVDYPRLIWEDTEGEPLPTPGYGGGSGTEEDPYLIYNSEHFNDIGKYECDPTGHFKLMADIVLDPMVEDNFYPIGDYDHFRGIFDGSYHKIVHPRYSQDDPDKFMFSVFSTINGLTGDGIVKNLGIEDPEITSAGIGVGGLVGCLRKGTIKNCYVKGGSVSGLNGVGGLAGVMELSEENLIANSYAITTVNGNLYVGGLVGYSSDGELNRSFSAGGVTGGIAGGLLGYIYIYGDVTVTDSFWDTTTSGQDTSAGGIGLPTEDMQQMATFINYGWDFVDEDVNGTNDIWRMCVDGIDYPHLSYEYSIHGDFACPDGLDLIDFSFLSGDWQIQGLEPYEQPDLTGDGVINIDDVMIFVEHWLEE
jgi:hypothetical protein